MANYLNSISVGLIVLNLFLRLPLQAVGAECVDTSTCVTRSLNFADHGVMSGHLELSLALLQAHVSAHSVTLIGLRLALVDDIPVDILSNVPSGTYDVEVDDDATGRRQPDRASYLTVITQIGLDHIAPQCPSYRTMDLKCALRLAAGTLHCSGVAKASPAYLLESLQERASPHCRIK